jgi:putative flippase GtrA
MSRFEQFIRFAIVGGVVTAIQYAILIALVQGAIAGAVAASSVGFAVSALANYALNRRFTFRSSQAHAEALPKFAIVALLGLAVNASLIWLFHIPVGLHYLLAQVLATGGTLLWNFTLNRIWTFSPSSLPHYHHKETP